MTFFVAVTIVLIIIINNNNKRVLFTDGLCHIKWFSIGHCIKTKNYSPKMTKINIKIDELKNVTLGKLIEFYNV